MAVLAGRKELMDFVVHPDPARRVLLAGTYNAHPVPTLAAIATIERLLENGGEVYRRVEAMGARMQAGLEAIVRKLGLAATVSRQGSAFCLYFMDHAPVDWHDLASHHQFELDEEMRRGLIPEGVYCFPLATKQCSISAAHTDGDIDETLQAIERVLPGVCSRSSERYA
jgi:glutamate-1-semialdehyde 2,1-aminomutase